MKFIAILSILVSSAVYAKEVKDFNFLLINDMKKEIVKDGEKFKTKPSRNPASVESEVERPIEEESKIDKNVRQIGPKTW